MLSCKRALPGHSGNGGKRRESWQSRLRNWNSTSVPPVAPRWQSCQFWPIAMERKYVSNVNKDRNSKWKINFPRANETAVKRWNTRKLLSSRFHRKVTGGVRSKEEHSKSGKPSLAPASALGIGTTGYFVSFVAYLELRILFLQKCLKQRCLEQLNKLRLSPATKTDYKLTGINWTEFVCCIRC